MRLQLTPSGWTFDLDKIERRSCEQQPHTSAKFPTQGSADSGFNFFGVALYTQRQFIINTVTTPNRCIRQSSSNWGDTYYSSLFALIAIRLLYSLCDLGTGSNSFWDKLGQGAFSLIL